MAGIAVEQACRFRMRNGYGICAKSAGVSDKSAERMGDEFNDIMNSLFGGRPGQCVLSCVQTEEDAFLALCTMRTDMHGRLAIFTHSYLIPTAEYRRLMEENPAKLLFAPLDKMYTSLPGAASLPLAELQLEHPCPSLKSLREKYQLDDSHYALLIWSAYEAICSQSSLCISFAGTVQNRIEAIRELCYCTLQGLLPSMRGQISYSSGCDMRRQICIEDAQGGCIGGPGIRFCIGSDDSDGRMEDLDELEQEFVLQLAHAEPEQREGMLRRLERWLGCLLMPGKDCSLGLILAAYFLGEKKAIGDTAARKVLADLTTAAKERRLREEILDSVLETLMQSMERFPLYGGELLIQRAEQQNKQQFEQQVLNLMDRCTEPEKAGLLQMLLDKPQSCGTDRMVRQLFQGVRPDSEALEEKLRSRLLQWLVAHPTRNDLAYAAALLKRQSAACCKETIEDLLKTGQLENPTPHRLEMLNVAFHTGVQRLQEMEQEQICCCALSAPALERWIHWMNSPDLPESLAQESARYCVKTQYACPGKEEERVGELLEVCLNSPRWGKELMEVARAEFPRLNDQINLQTFLSDIVSREELIKTCTERLSALDLAKDSESARRAGHLFVQFFQKEKGGLDSRSLLEKLKEESWQLAQTHLAEQVQTGILEQEAGWALEQCPDNGWVIEGEGWLALAEQLGLQKLCTVPEYEVIKAIRQMEQGGPEQKISALMGKTDGLRAEKKQQLADSAPQLMIQLAKKGVFSWELPFLYAYQGEDGALNAQRLYDLLEQQERDRSFAWPAVEKETVLDWVRPEQRRALGKELKRLAGRAAGQHTQEIIRVLLEKGPAGKAQQTDPDSMMNRGKTMAWGIYSKLADRLSGKQKRAEEVQEKRSRSDKGED